MNQLEEFKALGLSDDILTAIAKKGFETPSAIQSLTIPHLLTTDKDIIAQAQTGTGKTAAFGLPIIQMLTSRRNIPQAIVLVPTRELALQVTQELISFNTHDLSIAPIYGGASMTEQLRRLKKGIDIVVGTPGRILDHIRRGTLDLSAIAYLVLDEADEMLNMGFVKDVTRIIEATPIERELVLFSATTNQDVLTIAWKYQNDPVEVRIEATKENRPQITQYVINTEREQKYENLLYLLDSDVYQKIMVFINTKDMTQRLCKRLKDAGYPAECLHGDMRQSVRNEVMQGFRKGKFQILLATDVAARGIDVDDVEAVINYDLPNENEYYLHRIGRTGRAKRHGVAFTLLTYTESVRFDEILKYIMAKPIPLHFDEMGILCKEDGEPFFENM